MYTFSSPHTCISSMFNLLFIYCLSVRQKKYEDIFLQMSLLPCALTPMYRKWRVRRSRDPSLYKDSKLPTGILLGLPPDLNFTNCLMSRPPRPPTKKDEIKTSEFLIFVVELYFYLTPGRLLRSAGWSLQGSSSFWYVGLIFITSGTFTRDLLVELELLFWKKITNTHTKLHWCQLIWGFSVTCAVSNVGDVPAHPPMRLRWFDAVEVRCG